MHYPNKKLLSLPLPPPLSNLMVFVQASVLYSNSTAPHPLPMPIILCEHTQWVLTICKQYNQRLLVTLYTQPCMIGTIRCDPMKATQPF